MLTKVKIKNNESFNSFLKLMTTQGYRTLDIQQVYQMFQMKPPKYVIAFIRDESIRLQRVDDNHYSDDKSISLDDYATKIKSRLRLIQSVKLLTKSKKRKLLALWQHEDNIHALVSSTISEQYSRSLYADISIIDNHFVTINNTMCLFQSSNISIKIFLEIQNNDIYTSPLFSRVLTRFSQIKSNDSTTVQKFIIDNI